MKKNRKLLVSLCFLIIVALGIIGGYSLKSETHEETTETSSQSNDDLEEKRDQTAESSATGENAMIIENEEDWEKIRQEMEEKGFKPAGTVTE